MIKTSVIIPVYNTGIYIEECIECVFHQTQKEIEVIAINDGSTDDSLDILLILMIIFWRIRWKSVMNVLLKINWI